MALALDEDEGSGGSGGGKDSSATEITSRKKLRIGILDFDMVHMSNYDSVDTEKYLDKYNVTDWSSYARSFETKVLKCVVGEHEKRGNPYSEMVAISPLSLWFRRDAIPSRKLADDLRPHGLGTNT